ncbi:MAG: glutathione S-transferase family protein [Boseongicola sp.]|nr:glutathione S-transferase family protein [Boseongicola sp.]
MVKLFWAKNTISGASAIALNEGGVHWDSIEIRFADAEQTKPEYLEINPKGRVPALSTPEGVITETGAILEYIAAVMVPGLVPADPLHAARMREIMFYLASTMHVNHAHKMRGSRWANDASSFQDMASKVPETMTASCAFIEPLITGPYFFGDDITLADIWFYPIFTWLEGDGVDVSAFPNITAWGAAMKARSSVKLAHQQGLLG